MRIPVHAQTEEVADGHSATSAQPPHATLVPATKVSSPPTPYPIGSSSFLDTPGALLEGLRCYPLSARSRKRTRFLGKLSKKLWNSR
jgi:hypothetical protein